MDAAGLGTTLGEALLSGRTEDSPGSAASPETRGCASTQGLTLPREAARRTLDGSFVPRLYLTHAVLKVRTTAEAEWTRWWTPPPQEVKVS